MPTLDGVSCPNCGSFDIEETYRDLEDIYCVCNECGYEFTDTEACFWNRTADDEDVEDEDKW